MKLIRITCMFGGFLSLALSMSAQITQLVVFDQTNGSNPAAALIQGTDGNFYGQTGSGCGTVFGMTPSGELTMLYDFPGGSSGCKPTGLVQGANGNFYGATYGGGVPGFLGGVASGVVFEITPRGKPKTLHEFCTQQDPDGYCTDGAGPEGSLLLGNDGNFYGTTSQGTHGSYNYAYPGGTVFSITPSGVVTTLHIFCPDGTCAYGEGYVPQAALIQGTDGNLYGTTLVGGTGGGDYGGGTVFKISPDGKTFAILHSFCQSYGDYNCNDGTGPTGLIQGADGNFYGTTSSGGPITEYAYGQGTVFKITPTGEWTPLYGFDGGPDGGSPNGLIQASDGNFYGTTSEGGANGGPSPGYGTVFQITPSGALTTLYSFCSQIVNGVCTDGNNPVAALVQATSGTLYGTTIWGGDSSGVCGGSPGGTTGGDSGCGTVFSLSTGLGPFVTIQPSSGKAGAAVKILGNNFTGATSVMFDGTAAVFKVVKSSEITATVPTGAGTGSVTVTTPSGTLTSSQPFRVTPKVTGFTPPSGPVGTSVTITGVSLAQTTIVTFGGVQATTVNVNSDTQVTATVPMGAVTGKIAVTTPGGTATSAKSFKVTK